MEISRRLGVRKDAKQLSITAEIKRSTSTSVGLSLSEFRQTPAAMQVFPSEWDLGFYILFRRVLGETSTAEVAKY